MEEHLDIKTLKRSEIKEYLLSLRTYSGEMIEDFCSIYLNQLFSKFQGKKIDLLLLDRGKTPGIRGFVCNESINRSQDQIIQALKNWDKDWLVIKD